MRTRRVLLPRGRAVVLEFGDTAADPLVFLHGWGMAPQTYLRALLPLTRAGVRVVVPALPGFAGSSPLPPRADIYAVAERVRETLDALGEREPFFLAGHSLGGGVALALAARHPDQVRSLTLVNAVGGGPGGAGTARRNWLHWALGASAELDPRGLLPLVPTLLRRTVPAVLGHPLSAVSTAAVALGANLTADAQALIASGLPVLFVWGDQDRLITPGALRGVADALGPEVVAGRHGWLLSQPEAFADLLRNALVIHALVDRRRRP